MDPERQREKEDPYEMGRSQKGDREAGLGGGRVRRREKREVQGQKEKRGQEDSGGGGGWCWKCWVLSTVACPPHPSRHVRPPLSRSSVQLFS